MPVQGSLRELPALEVLQLIGSQRKTVTLRIEAEDLEIGLHFEDGLLRAAHRRHAAAGEPYLETLIGLGHISPHDAMQLAEQVRESGRDLWTVSLEIPRLERETCEQAYRRAAEALIDRLLLCDRGHFALLPLEPVESVFAPGLSVEEVLIDAMRRLDEMASWKQGALPEGTVPCLTRSEELVVTSDPLRRALVRQMDGRRTIAQIVEATRLGEHEIYQAIADGIEQGWIQILEGLTPVDAPPTSARETLRRSPALVALLILLAVAIGSSWVGRRLRTDQTAWRETRTQWEETDLRRLIEVYRYRNGAYPADLASLETAGLPVPAGSAERWAYAPQEAAYRLVPR
jgi:hypothetical protein